MRLRFYTFFLIGLFIIAGCALDYNNYPYEQKADESTQKAPANSVEDAVPSTEPSTNNTAENTTVSSETSSSSEATAPSSSETKTVTTSTDSPVNTGSNQSTEASPPQDTTTSSTASSASVESTAPSSSSTEEQTKAAYVPQTQIFTVTASQFSFSPSTITVNKGDTLVINFSTTDVSHGFSLPDFNVNLTATEVGKVVTTSFVADKAGNFIFACSVMCGSGHSEMKGSFVVNDV